MRLSCGKLVLVSPFLLAGDAQSLQIPCQTSVNFTERRGVDFQRNEHLF